MKKKSQIFFLDFIIFLIMGLIGLSILLENRVDTEVNLEIYQVGEVLLEQLTTIKIGDIEQNIIRENLQIRTFESEDNKIAQELILLNQKGKTQLVKDITKIIADKLVTKNIGVEIYLNQTQIYTKEKLGTQRTESKEFIRIKRSIAINQNNKLLLETLIIDLWT